MITKPCAECGKDFEVDDTKRNWQHKKICSDECQRAYTNKQARLKYKPIEWPQKKVCVRCSADFLVHEGGNIAQKYCNAECQYAGKLEKKAAEVEARRQPKRCEHCGNAFIAGKFTAHKQRFCSNECRVFAKNKMRYQDGTDRAKIRNSYKYDFKIIKPQILERDNYACVICESREDSHVHHWDNSGGHDHVNNAHENLVTLCNTCHSAIHRVTLARIDGKWVLDSKIFALLGLTGEIPIKS